MTHANRIALWVEQTSALIQPAQPTAPPEELPDDQLAALNALIIHSSPEMVTLTIAFDESARAFRNCAQAVTDEREHPSERSREVRENLRAARDAVDRALEQLGARANAELRGEPASK